MQFDRRKVLTGIGAGIAALGIKPAFAQGVRYRRNISQMAWNDPDLVALANGIGYLRQNSGLLSMEAQRAFHANYWAQHSTWRFLPWHRLQLACFEAIIASVTGKSDFALPYWDWQEAQYLPGAVFNNPDLSIGGRVAGPGTNIAAQRWNYDQRAANLFYDDFNSFAGGYDYAGRVEAYGHNLVHAIVGGAMGELENAPLDPVFWLHHANIDRVWSTWHDQTGPAYPFGFQDEPLEGFFGPNGYLSTVYAADILETWNLGYAYDRAYPNEWFNVTPGLTKAGFKRKLQKQQSWRLGAAGTGTADALVTMPDSVLKDLRSDKDDLLDLTGEGIVRMALPNLKGKVVRMVASAPDGAKADGKAMPGVVLFAAPAFFHEGSAHAGHTGARKHPDDWAFSYKFGPQLINLIGRSKGPIELRIDTQTVDGKTVETAKPAVRDLGMVVTLKRHEWVAQGADK